MGPEGIDYKAVLSDMEEKRVALDAAIENMKRWLGVVPTVAQARATTGEMASDTFFAMSIPEAVKKYLTMMRSKRTTNDIVDALERGGITHNSKNFKNTVSTALYREDAKLDGEIVKVAEGEWGLTEWYPGIKAKRARNGKSEDSAAADPKSKVAEPAAAVTPPAVNPVDEFLSGSTDDVPF